MSDVDKDEAGGATPRASAPNAGADAPDSPPAWPDSPPASPSAPLVPGRAASPPSALDVKLDAADLEDGADTASPPSPALERPPLDRMVSGVQAPGNYESLAARQLQRDRVARVTLKQLNQQDSMTVRSAIGLTLRSWIIALMLAALSACFVLLWTVLPLQSYPTSRARWLDALPYQIMSSLTWGATEIGVAASLILTLFRGFPGHRKRVHDLWVWYVPCVVIINLITGIGLWALAVYLENPSMQAEIHTLFGVVFGGFLYFILARRLTRDAGIATSAITVSFSLIVWANLLITILFLTFGLSLYVQLDNIGKLLYRVLAYPLVVFCALFITRALGLEMLMTVHGYGFEIPYSALHYAGLYAAVYADLQGRFLLLSFDNLTFAFLTAIAVGVVEVALRASAAWRLRKFAETQQWLGKHVSFLALEDLERVALVLHSAETTNFQAIIEVWSILTSAVQLIVLQRHRLFVAPIYRSDALVSDIALNVAFQLLVEVFVDLVGYYYEGKTRLPSLQAFFGGRPRIDNVAPQWSRSYALMLCFVSLAAVASTFGTAVGSDDYNRHDLSPPSFGS